MLTSEQKDRRIEDLEKSVSDLQGELAYVRKQMEALKRKLFGSPASEKVSDEQLQLALAELEKETLEQTESEKEVIGYCRRKPKLKEAISKLPEDIETIVEEVVPEEVKQSPDYYERIGEDKSEKLDVIPMRFIRRVYVRGKYKLKGDIDAKPFIAKHPDQLIPGGLPAAGLVAQLIVWKYADHLPLYRLEKIFRERFGVVVSRQRMCDWIEYAAENWLSMIYRSIRNGLISEDYLQIDETPIRYLDADRKGKSHQGYYWVFGRPQGDVCFDWRLSRGKAGAEAILSQFEGIVQSDGYAAYDSACQGKPIIQLGCWTHARRKFYDAYKNGELEAARYLLPIKELYQIERDLPEDANQRSKIRKERSLPILDAIKEFLDCEREVYLAKSAMSSAVHYALNQWKKLIAYVEHGETRIDNNLTEQSIRPCKLGAKNWLFVGSPKAGKRSAIIYTLLECCRRQGVEPMAYLSDVLRKLPNLTNFEAEALTPENWKQNRVNTL
ncbi:IS66 family transposase [Puniceicoccaceae bacterium K14]|nr:IS66 family transposase [Puniceicoccaceae bacterium K14]